MGGWKPLYGIKRTGTLPDYEIDERTRSKEEGGGRRSMEEYGRGWKDKNDKGGEIQKSDYTRIEDSHYVE